MRRWTDEQLIEAVRLSDSHAEVLRRLGLRPSGRDLSDHYARLALDTSHFTRGSREAALAVHRNAKMIPLDRLLIEGCSVARHIVKRAILRKRLLPNECSECGLESFWNGRPLVLILDHKNGVKNDNRLENLRFLCPNCNSQQPTFAGRNNKRSSELAV